MRTTARTLTALAAAVPLVAAAVVPATAAQSSRFTASGTTFDASTVVVGELAGTDGNVHHVYVGAQDTGAFTDSYGYVESFTCADGVTDPYAGGCELAGVVELYGVDVDLTSAKGSASLAGTYDLGTTTCDEATGECWTDAVGSLEVALSATGSGQAARSRSTETMKDPATGYTYRGTSTATTWSGPVSGTVGDLQVTDGSGSFGTFKFTAAERIR